MLFAALRDMQWRRRRLLIAVIGTGLVFAISLTGAGIGAAFRNETARSVAAARADRWLVPEGVSGPLTAVRPFPVTAATEVAGLPGVQRADPIVFTRSAIETSGTVDVNLFGVVPGGLGDVDPSEGRSLARSGEVVADRSTGADVGDVLHLGGRDFDVVGTVAGHTLFGAAPNLYVTIGDAQALQFDGAPLATAVLTAGVPAPGTLPDQVKALDNAAVRADALRILRTAVATIDFVNVLLWLVAVTIMSSMLYLSAIDRTRDIAVFKATGTSTAAISLGVVFQAVVMAMGASAVAVALALAMGPVVPIRPEVPGRAYVAVPVAALLAGAVGSLAAVRRAGRIQPALAFG